MVLLFGTWGRKTRNNSRMTIIQQIYGNYVELILSNEHKQYILNYSFEIWIEVLISRLQRMIVSNKGNHSMNIYKFSPISKLVLMHPDMLVIKWLPYRCFISQCYLVGIAFNLDLLIDLRCSRITPYLSFISQTSHSETFLLVVLQFMALLVFSQHLILIWCKNPVCALIS